MRKKVGKTNSRKFRLKGVLSPRRSREDDGAWITFDNGQVPPVVSVRRKAKRRSLIIRALALLCISLSIPIGIKWGYGKVFFENEEFLLKRLNLQSDGGLSELKLAEIANVAAGMNLMELDLGAIEEQISRLPQVEKVSATREMPDTLNLIVRERIPLAWLSSPPLGIRPWDMERGYLIDASGALFRCLDLNEGMKTLPVIEVFKIANPVEGTQVESDGILAGLKLIQESDHLFLDQGLQISEVRVRDEWSVDCSYGGKLLATFAIHDIDRGLTDLGLILKKTAESGKALATVNVAAVKNIPVTFVNTVETSGEPSVDSGGVTAPATAAPLDETDVREKEQEKHLQSILNGG